MHTRRVGRRHWLMAAVLVAALAMVAGACGDDGSEDGEASSTSAGSATSQAEELSGTLVVMSPGPLKAFLESAAAAFGSEHPGVNIEMNTGHVPTLLTQLQEGVTADVLVTPDAATMAQADAKGLLGGPAGVIARSPMALVVPAGNPAGVEGVDALGDADLRVGVCAPELPCGKLADQLAANDSITLAADTLEPGGSPGVVTKASTGEIDVGLAFAVDVSAGGDKVEAIAIPAGSNVSSEVSVAYLAASADSDLAMAFVDFLVSPAGMELAVDAGFLRP